MTASDEVRFVERAADDLLLLVTKADTLGVDALGPDDAAATLLAYTDDVAGNLAYRFRGGRLRINDAMVGVRAATDALLPAAMGHLLLSAALLEWVATRTGLNAEIVIREVLGTEGEEA